MASGTDGCGYLLRFGGGKDEYYVGRRLLDGLQQCVESTGGEHVHLVYYIYLIAACLGGEQNLILDLADIIYTCVACSVDLNDVNAVTSGDLLAVGADSTRQGSRSCFAVQSTCEDTRR